jgi:hypothetical protein
VEIEVNESGAHAASGLGRRALIGAGVGGAALSLVPFVSGHAAASATTDETTTSTTTPPLRPTADDVALLAQAQQLELTAQALYDEALALSGWTDDQALVVTYLREAHQEYANALSGLLGRDAPGMMSEKVFGALKSDFAGSAEGVLAAAYALEATAAATHAEVLSQLQGTDAAALIASIQMNEARYGTVLADMQGSTDEADLLVTTDAESLVGQL